MAAIESYDWDGFADGMEKLMRDYYSLMFEQSYADAADVLPVPVVFDQSNPHIKKTIDGLAKRIRGVAETTREDVRLWVERATEDGLTIQEVARQIRSDAADISKSRALTIARTETATAYNLGATHAYEDAGIEKVTVMDGDDDEECAAADGQVWTLEEARANPTAHPNCVRAFSPYLD